MPLLLTERFDHRDPNLLAWGRVATRETTHEQTNQDPSHGNGDQITCAEQSIQDFVDGREDDFC